MTAVAASSLADDTPLPLEPPLPSEYLSRRLHERLSNGRLYGGESPPKDFVLDALEPLMFRCYLSVRSIRPLDHVRFQIEQCSSLAVFHSWAVSQCRRMKR
jgi:hypothetical protein